MKLSVLVSGPDSPSILRAIRQAEDAGLDGVWMTSGGTAPDPLTIYAAAAAQTERIGFGTAIIQTFPRHPLALVQQAVVLDQLAPGRLTLGVGPSGPMVIGPVFGIPFERPQEHLREYLTILRAALHDGAVDFRGKRHSAKARLAAPTGVRVMGAALRANAFRLCGETADGAISWVCPAAYLRDQARPAMDAGAESAGREPGALVGHVLVVPTEDPGVAAAAVNAALGFFPKVPTYQDMFRDAGFPEAAEKGEWSPAMIDAVTIYGDPATIAARVRALPGFGIDEAMFSVLAPVGDATGHARAVAAIAAAR